MKQQRTKRQKGDRRIMRWLILCFPAGLMLMWSDRCTWNRAIKSSISLACVMLVLAVVLPLTRTSAQTIGGVQIVSLVPAAEQMGPTMRAGALPYDVYVPKYIPAKSVLVEPTPTPTPYYVYTNDGGAYYHTKKCSVVKSTTYKATLIEAVSAGYKRCKKCKPPTMEDVYGLDY